jgi:hypothetical protein
LAEVDRYLVFRPPEARPRARPHRTDLYIFYHIKIVKYDYYPDTRVNRACAPPILVYYSQ